MHYNHINSIGKVFCVIVVNFGAFVVDFVKRCGLVFNRCCTTHAKINTQIQHDRFELNLNKL